MLDESMPLLLPLCRIWRRRINAVGFAYQPIVAADQITVIGFEALLRGTRQLGFRSIKDYFDMAHRDGVLHAVDLSLRYKALKQCAPVLRKGSCLFFYNLDTRCVTDINHQTGHTAAMIDHLGLEPGVVVLELSEQHEIVPEERIQRLLDVYRSQGYRIALDDYGVGFAGLRALFLTEPEMIKVDRFFVKDLHVDTKKQEFLSRLVEFAHDNLACVVAEGVENHLEAKACIHLGVDYLQGFYFHRPTFDLQQALAFNESASRWCIRKTASACSELQ